MKLRRTREFEENVAAILASANGYNIERHPKWLSVKFNLTQPRVSHYGNHELKYDFEIAGERLFEFVKGRGYHHVNETVRRAVQELLLAYAEDYQITNYDGSPGVSFTLNHPNPADPDHPHTLFLIKERLDDFVRLHGIDGMNEVVRRAVEELNKPRPEGITLDAG